MLTDIDIKLFYLINKNCENRIFDFLMPFISELASREFLLLLSLVLLCSALILKKKEFKGAGILLFAGIAITYLVVYFLKDLVARPRPFIVLPDVHLLVTDKMGSSFPSGHSAQAFMAAKILSNFFKKRALFFSIAVLIGFSRVYLGVHFISDVIVSAFIGITIGYILVKIPLTK